MTSKQAKKLKKAIKRLVAANVARAWRGAGPAEEGAGLDALCKLSKRRVNDLIESHISDWTLP